MTLSTARAALQLVFAGIALHLCRFIPLTNSFSIAFRSATPKDVFLARTILFREAMNPLSISQDRLLVAVDTDADDRVVGFGQIRELDASVYSELASLFVLPEVRRQGIGSAIVEELLSRHNSNDICLLTLRPTMALYERHGFRLLENEALHNMPQSFQLEYAAGSVLSKVLGNELVCMVSRQLDRHEKKTLSSLLASSVLELWRRPIDRFVESLRRSPNFCSSYDNI
jgi:GNAT superfamily N-acetyltransferase